MQLASPLHEQTPVGDLEGQRVLEGVLGVGEQARLVEELGSLELRQPRVEEGPRGARPPPCAGARTARPCRSPR